MDLVNNLIDDKEILEAGGKKIIKKDKKEESISSTSVLNLFGWFSSGNDSSKEEITPEEIEAENSAKQCIQKCNVKMLFDSSKFVFLIYFNTFRLFI